MNRFRQTLLAYDVAAEEGDSASRDVFTQMEAIEGVLAEMDMPTERLPVSLDCARLKERIVPAPDVPPPLVFNLVESLDGADRLQTLFPMLLESWGIPFTGSGSQAMYLTNNKVLAKTVLTGAGAPFPACCRLNARGNAVLLPEDADIRGRWILKPLESHASLFMDDSAVDDFTDLRAIGKRLGELGERRGMTFFAERYLEGREFNISVVEDGGEPRVLAPAEILFLNFPADRPRIVGYAAKWDEESEEYKNTPRAFGTLEKEPELAEELSRLAKIAFRAFGLSGYARVDFRVDASGQPCILEANANPCLSPDAGLAAAAAESGWSYAALCGRIIAAVPQFAQERRPFTSATSGC